MSTVIEVTMKLSFFLRLEGPFSVRYEKVCRESQIKELMGHDVQISFSRNPSGFTDVSGLPQQHTTVAVRVETTSVLAKDAAGTFAIRNVLEILNRVISSYQGATGEVGNSGFIRPLGTSDIQLYADIRVNGQDIRDRWPSPSFTTFPLSSDQERDFADYLTAQKALPLSRLFVTGSILSLEIGEYPLAVFQAATAVELRLTQVVGEKLRATGWSNDAIEPYERMTLGQKLQIPQTDPRSVETYFSGAVQFATIFNRVRDNVTPLRNRVVHRGYLASQQDAMGAVKMARDFLAIVS